MILRTFFKEAEPHTTEAKINQLLNKMSHQRVKIDKKKLQNEIKTLKTRVNTLTYRKEHSEPCRILNRNLKIAERKHIVLESIYNQTGNKGYIQPTYYIHGEVNTLIDSYGPNMDTTLLHKYLIPSKKNQLIKVGFTNQTGYFISQHTLNPLLTQINTTEGLKALAEKLYKPKQGVTEELIKQLDDFLYITLIGGETKENQMDKNLRQAITSELTRIRKQLEPKEKTYPMSGGLYVYQLMRHYFSDIEKQAVLSLQKEYPIFKPIVYSDYSFIYEVPEIFSMRQITEKLQKSYKPLKGSPNPPELQITYL